MASLWRLQREISHLYWYTNCVAPFIGTDRQIQSFLTRQWTINSLSRMHARAVYIIWSADMPQPAQISQVCCDDRLIFPRPYSCHDVIVIIIMTCWTAKRFSSFSASGSWQRALQPIFLVILRTASRCAMFGCIWCQSLLVLTTLLLASLCCCRLARLPRVRSQPCDMADQLCTGVKSCIEPDLTWTQASGILRATSACRSARTIVRA